MSVSLLTLAIINISQTFGNCFGFFFVGFALCLLGICQAGKNNTKILETAGRKTKKKTKTRRKINVKLCRIDLLTYIFRLCFTLIDSSACSLYVSSPLSCCWAGITFFLRRLFCALFACCCNKAPKSQCKYLVFIYAFFFYQCFP